MTAHHAIAPAYGRGPLARLLAGMALLLAMLAGVRTDEERLRLWQSVEAATVAPIDDDGCRAAVTTTIAAGHRILDAGAAQAPRALTAPPARCHSDRRQGSAGGARSPC
jgi:hypothetical protein